MYLNKTGFKKSAIYSVLEALHLRVTGYMARTGMVLHFGDGDGGDDLKAKIDAAVKEATEGLAAKNAELLSEVKELRKGKTIKPEDVEKLETQIETLQADLAKAQKDLKTANTAAEQATNALKSEQGFTQKLLVENGLTAELTKNGVTNPAFIKAAQSLLASQTQIVADGEKRIAKIGDKTLAEFIPEWAKSDEGKHFVAAPGNNGGGAGGGSNGAGSAKTKTRSEFDAMSHADRSAFSKEGGQVVDG
jgi:hypothetical protein